MVFMIDEIKEKVQTFIEENSKLAATVIGLFLFLSLSAVVVLFFHAGKRKEQKGPALPPEVFVQKNDFLPPAEITLTEDYYFSRVPEDKWSEEERDRWFTNPDETSLKELGKANDGIAKRITEAAP